MERWTVIALWYRYTEYTEISALLSENFLVIEQSKSVTELLWEVMSPSSLEYFRQKLDDHLLQVS